MSDANLRTFGKINVPLLPFTKQLLGRLVLKTVHRSL